MSEENVLKSKNSSLEIWKDQEEIRKLFAPDLTDKEFQFFIGLGMSMQANPFKREIWAVKYDKNKPAQIFLGRDFDRKKAQEQPDYNGHQCDAVYSNDNFSVKNGMPEHSYNLKDRGDILGAYAIAWRKDIDHPFYVFVEFKEYNKNQSTWNQIPATMIKKVGEAQVLRMAWQDVYAGTYSETEQWRVVKNPYTEKKAPVKTEGKQVEAPSKESLESLETDLLDYFGSGESADAWLFSTTNQERDGVKYKGIKKFSDIKSVGLYKMIRAEFNKMKKTGDFELK